LKEIIQNMMAIAKVTAAIGRLMNPSGMCVCHHLSDVFLVTRFVEMVLPILKLYAMFTKFSLTHQG
jgi:hypothetical protein